MAMTQRNLKRTIVKLLQKIWSHSRTGESPSYALIASECKLSERLVRRYSDVLEAIGLIEKLKGGRVRLRNNISQMMEQSQDEEIPGLLNIDSLPEIEDVPEPGVPTLYTHETKNLTLEHWLTLPQIALQRDLYLRDRGFSKIESWTDFIREIQSNQQKLVTPLVERTRQFIDKISPVFLKLSEYRNALVNVSPQHLLPGDTYVGEKVVYPWSFEPKERLIQLIGIATIAKPKIWRVRSVLTLFPVIYSIAAWSCTFDGTKKINDGKKYFNPNVKAIRNRDIPFRELLSEYRSLKIGLVLAARFIAEIELWKLGAEALESESGINMFIRHGSVIFRGAKVPAVEQGDPALYVLKREYSDAVHDFYSLAREKNVTVVGTPSVRSSSFAENIIKYFTKSTVTGLRDNVLLEGVMQDRDSTCLMKVPGIPSPFSDNVYSFYLKKNTVCKFEFVAPSPKTDSLLEKQKEIISTVFPTLTPEMPVNDSWRGHTFGSRLVSDSTKGTPWDFSSRESGLYSMRPSVINEALKDAYDHLNELENIVDAAYETFVNELRRRLGER
jgi:hypothetical protein